MSRRRPKSTPRAARPVVVALVLGDAAKARADARRRYAQACARLEKRLAEIAAFKERDRPAFARWIETEFGDDLADAAKLRSEAEELEFLIDKVRVYSEVMGCSLRDALTIVRAAIDAGSEDDLWAEVERETRRDDEPGPRPEEPRPEEPHQENRSERRHREAEERREAPRRSPATDYLKGLYRKIVRLLHPDLRGDLSPLERQQWQAAQEAYAWKDAQRLEKLLGELEESEEGALDLDRMAIGDILELRKDVERRINLLVRELQGYKDDVAWEFRQTLHEPGRLDLLRRQIGFDLAVERAHRMSELAELREIVAGWERSRGKRRRREKGRSSVAW